MTSPVVPRTGFARWGGGLGLLLVLGWALRGSRVGPALGSVDGFEGTRVLSGLLHPQLSGALLGDVGRAAAQTLEIAVAGLLLSSVLAAPMALLLSSAAGGARLPRLLARLLATLLRGVPELIWALVLVTVVGLGPAAGTLALALHGAGLLAKLWSEQLDGVDPRSSRRSDSPGRPAQRRSRWPSYRRRVRGCCRCCSTSSSATYAPRRCSASSAPVASGRRSTWRCGCSTTASSGPS